MHVTNFKHDQPTRLQSSTADKRAKVKAWQALCRYVTTRDGGCCRACGRKTTQTLAAVPERAEHHHVVPRSIGGAESEQNICLLCKSCHDERHVTRRLHIFGNAERTLHLEQYDKTGAVLRRWESTR